MQDLTIEEMFAKLPGLFQADKADTSSSVVQFSISGEGGGDWVVRIQDGKCSVASGSVSEMDLSVSADATLLKDLVAGRQNPMMAFMQGKLRVKGDLALAQKLVSLFQVK